MDNAKFKRADIWFLLVVSFISIYLLYIVRISEFTYKITQDALGPGFLPTVSLIIVIGCALTLITIRIARNAEKIHEDEMKNYAKTTWISLLLVIIGLIYIYMTIYIGLVVSAFLALNALFYTLGYKKIKMMLFVSAITSLVIWFLFGKVINLYLPKAILF
jgi:hypothetical protein